ncbi:MAG: 2-C-methyl-D-erythritol 4-phosphate cytidylyltransferase [Bacteroidales bacterium]|nr:2-C-methyl-D-erythritol 4-phosphate cytidylyltransferase [Bacteroidales bacterium]
MKHVAVVLAGGTGSRMGGDVPKQFLQLAGREVIEHSVDVFDAHPAIDEVAVVVHPEWRRHFEALAARRRWVKLGAVIDGGAERWQSSLAAVSHYEGIEPLNLLLHDAARPWVTASMVSRVVEALEVHEAVAVAVPATDTLFRVEEGCIADIPPRADYYCAQTPQAFRYTLLKSAYRQARQDPAFVATDDCGVLHRYRRDVPIHIVQGAPENAKITFPNDII